jgi:phytoene desaturase (3,4-didehydrolycopene-forming)
MDAILVLVPCPTLQRNKDLGTIHRSEAIKEYSKQFTNENIAKVKVAVLERMKVSTPDISDIILHEVIDTPVTYADQYNVGAGTPFGLSHGFGQLSITRPTGRSPFMTKKNDNIFYCGASTRPGNGVPLVLTGAKLIAKQVIDYIQQNKESDDTSNSDS